MRINQVSNNNNQQSFGQLHVDGFVKNLISKRLNNSPEQLKILDELIERASKNKKVDIFLFEKNRKGTELTAIFKTTSDTIKYGEHKSENIFTKLFKKGGVLGFIERCVARAEVKAERIIGAKHVTNLDYIHGITERLYK